MKRKTIKKTAYRLLAALLVVSTLGANMVTLSYADEEAGKEETLCGLTEHTHIKDVCYEEKKELTCGIEEGEIHTHTIDCFEEQEQLTCEIEACEPHAHDETCMEEVETFLCGMEEAEPHTHSEACYTETKDLTCGQDACEAHAHTADCYAQKEIYTCGENEWPAHTHDETACYIQQQNLTCTQQEGDGHAHGDGCYEPETVLSCTMKSGEGHSHSEACRTVEAVLACGLEETEGHAHGDMCYGEPAQKLACGQEETEGHTHTEDCVKTEFILACEKEETEGHAHGDACYEKKNVQICPHETEVPHVHNENCYKISVNMSCQLEEHVHTEACYKELQELLERSVTDEHGLVTVTGLLPETATVQARELTEEEINALPVPVEQLLFAYDITIWVDGAEYQPETPVQVTVLPKNEEEAPVDQVEVRHVELDEETLEITSITKVESVVSENGELTFEAESFSIYFATEPIPTVNIEKDVAYRVYNTSGKAASGELLWTEATTLTVKANTGYEITGVTVADADGNDTTNSYVSQSGGVYTLTFPVPVAGVKNQTVSITAKELELQTVTFDLAKGDIVLTDDTYSGYVVSVDGTNVNETKSDAHTSGNRYVITQSNYPAKTDHTIKVGDYTSTSAGVTKDFVIVLDNVYAEDSTKRAHWTVGKAMLYVHNKGTSMVAVILKDNSSNILHSGTNRAGLEKGGGKKGNGTLVVTCEAGYAEWLKDPNAGHTTGEFCASGCTADCGSLEASSGNAWWDKYESNSIVAAAGIGTSGGGTSASITRIDPTICEADGSYVSSATRIDNSLRNLTFAGGKITATGAKGSDGSYTSDSGNSGGAPGIGVGACGTNSTTYSGGDAQGLKFTGGTITAVRGCYAASGIGGGYRGGKITVEIHGGTIVADGINKHNHQDEYKQKIRGAGIGGAGGGYNTAAPKGAEVTIYSGDITAYSQYGAAIGAGAGGSTGNGSNAIVNIYGGKINARTTNAYNGNGAGAAIGTGGSLGTGKGGIATVNIYGGDIIADSESGADIGGGGTNSTDTKGNGGEATVTITGGYVEAMNGGIGGGRANKGNGGEATVTISGGRVEATSIGGGDSKAGNGGTAVVTVNGPAEITLTGGIGGGEVTGATGGNGGAAEVYISDGTILSGSIGGGSTANPASKIGYAKAEISGGDITAQFIMAAGGAEPCSFTMTGGRLHDNNVTDNSVYTYASEFGGAVYMDDPGGVVDISGGTIEACTAKKGGAVYMTAGTMTLSGTGIIQSCKSVTADGEDGTGNGGAIYMGGGELHITGGSLSQNTAGQFGGGAYIENGTVIMSGGAVDNNTAQEGGGLYVSASADPADVGVKVFSGSVSGNTATAKGGAIAVVGDPAANAQNITITLGVNEKHTDTDLDGKQDPPIKHDANGEATAEEPAPYSHLTCPQINNNKVSTIGGGGGALYITGSVKTGSVTRLNLYCLTATGNDVAIPAGDNVPDGLSDFMKVDGGKVWISAADHTGAGAVGDVHGDMYIDGSFHVTGGQVDMYGSTNNPNFGNKPITVDVIDGVNDYFRDHRAASGDVRTITYVENFLENGVRTGRYRLYHAKVNQPYTLEIGMYSRTGYQMVSWSTKAEPADPDAILYLPNQVVTFNGNGSENGGTPEGVDDDGNLTLYGKWDVFGYDVQFNANAPTNATVLGSSEPYKQHFSYEDNKALEANRFKVQGYAFQGWSLDPYDTTVDPEDYTDQETVGQLTSSNGVTLNFYAVWAVCEHNDAGKIQYAVEQDTPNTATLKKTCTACSATWERTLSASGGTYTGNAYKATLTTTPGWEDALTIAYSTAGNSPLADVPVDAGDYKASVALPDGTTKATVTYTIAQAWQSAPNPAPTYTAALSGSTLTLTINKCAKSSIGLDAEYRMTYKDDSVEEIIELNTPTESTDTTVTYKVTLPQAQTLYYVEARYPGTSNYKPSDWVRATQIITYKGATVTIYYAEGISYNPPEPYADGNGLVLDMWLDNGYFFEGEDFTFDIECTTNGKNPPIRVKEGEKWILKEFETDSNIIVHVGGVKANASISAKIAEKQLFGTTPSGATASISHDSAFTAYFKVENYNNDTDYNDLALNFGSNLPVGTTIIMVDRSGAENSYWYYNVASATNSVDVTSFTAMGGSAKYHLTANMELQFVVDFSRTTNGGPQGSLSVSMPIAVKTGSNATPLNAAVTAVLEKGTFELTSAVLPWQAELTAGVACKHTARGAASKWDYRHTALVVCSVGNLPLPADARLKVTQGNDSITRAPNESGAFVIPTDTLKPDENTFTLALDSQMKPAGEADYRLQIQWMASDSFADTAPMNGERLAGPLDIVLSKQADIAPAVEITATQLVENKHLEFAVNHRNLADHVLQMSVEVWNEEKQVYADTGITTSYKLEAGNRPVEADVALTTNPAGSYRLRFTVETANGDLVTEVYHYFVISSSSAGGKNGTGGDDSGASDPTGSGTTENGTTENGTN